MDICCQNCIACLKRPKTNEKEAGIGPFFNKKNIGRAIASDARDLLFESRLSLTLKKTKMKI